jgi:hypothetical protein
MQTFISLGMFMQVVKIVTKVDQRCAILSPKLERIQILGCNPNVIEPTTIEIFWLNCMEDVIIIATRCHTMCNVMPFATIMFFVTCPMQLDTIVVACDIYKLKLIVNPLLVHNYFLVIYDFMTKRVLDYHMILGCKHDKRNHTCHLLLIFKK